ncbi:MAG: Vi polysaccharide biosynthesis UDP-N-acetylglucosamine C-6 dehydrogenase TviB [Pseudohongiellaceae bacterium]
MPPRELSSKTRIAVLGLGYVGLPLAFALASRYPVRGYDINSQRVKEINAGHDRNGALNSEAFREARQISYSSDPATLAEADIYIITAPTPVTVQNQPDLEPLKSATRLVAEHLKRDNVVIFESTVYPGATEEECIPLLAAGSGLTLNESFFVGYSPERVNPGDNAHSILNTVKVTSGSNAETAELVDQLYAGIISAGTFRASSIKVAEAAKVIENTQRDLNIALVNELAILFDRLGIETREVLKAAGSKWNFLPFTPGLVGGHCIGVDPYYLTFKAQQVGYHPEVILAGRRINDGMGQYVADQVVKLMLKKRIHVTDSRVLVLGLAFKENCPDTRNSKVVDIVNTLRGYHANVDVFDPWVDASESEHLVSKPQPGEYDAVVIAVAHQQFVELGIEALKAFGKNNSVIFDVKQLFPRDQVDGSL